MHRVFFVIKLNVNFLFPGGVPYPLWLFHVTDKNTIMYEHTAFLLYEELQVEEKKRGKKEKILLSHLHSLLYLNVQC